MRRVRLLLLATVLLLAPLGSATASIDPPSQGSSATVDMGSNFFAPREVRVDVGGTVTWNALGNGHDVRADDGSFWLWRGETGGNDGQTRSVTFEEEGVVPFYCTLHGGPGGNGMAGIVFVGDAELDSPPDLEVPSTEHPTLRSALREARRGSTITLAPGTHRAGQRLIQDGVTIRGGGDAPGDVELRAATSAGLRVQADDITLANLRIASGSSSGVLAEDVDRLRLEDVEIATDEVGVRFVGGRGLTVRGGWLADHRRAGLLLTGCDPCDARIEDVRVTGNRFGIDVADAAGAVIRGNQLTDNGVGIRAASTPAGPTATARTLTILDNDLRDNVAGGFGSSLDADVPTPTGAAIWLAGARQAVIHDNRISGAHRYGVSVTALLGLSRDVVVRDNLAQGADDADLAWDGVGTGVCFADNVTGDDTEPTSQPPMLQTVSACDLGLPVGVPDPRPLAPVLEDLLGGGDGPAEVGDVLGGPRGSER